MKKILIVDDQIISLRMTDHILAGQYETICATSGREAIELYKKEMPDMILSDLHMPEMSGFELQSSLQEMYAEQIPIMFMTADASEHAENKGFENGAVDYIRKPFRADILLRRVENILKNVDKIQGLKKAAETDPMTGLLNKASSQDEIGTAVRTIPGTLMMIDLDSFKHVNDLYGHDMGDKILIRFAEIIKSAIRAQDIAGRMGGDEFIAFCKHVKDEAVIAEKSRFINRELLKSAHEYMGEDMNIPLGASIGAVMVPNEGTDFLTLYKKADKALYKVKQNGKHGYSLYSEHAAGSEDDSLKATGIAGEITILSERNREKGAYALPYEQFQLIYRFLSRMELNYHKKNHLIIFSLHDVDADKDEISTMTEEFYEAARTSLRASDVITKKGRSQVMVLLLEAKGPDINMVINRVLNKWNATGAPITPTFELSLIE